MINELETGWSFDIDTSQLIQPILVLHTFLRQNLFASDLSFSSFLASCFAFLSFPLFLFLDDGGIVFLSLVYYYNICINSCLYITLLYRKYYCLSVCQGRCCVLISMVEITGVCANFELGGTHHVNIPLLLSSPESYQSQA